MHSLFQILILVLALCLDAFVASFSYGASRIRIPLSSALVLDIICTATLAFALALGAVIGQWIPLQITSAICFILLFLLGVTKIFNFLLKSWILHSESGIQRVSFRLLDYRFILKVYADNTQADRDHSLSLSVRESVPLALALSLDGCTAGFGAGLLGNHAGYVILTSLIVTALAIVTGGLLGARFARKAPLDLSWLGGALLILLAFWKLR